MDTIGRIRRRLRGPVAALALLASVLLPPAQAGSRFDPLEQPAARDPRASAAVLLAVARADKRLVAVGESGIVLLSDDDGATWRQSGVPVSVTLTNVRFVSARRGWAVGHGGVVLRTDDGGSTWTKLLDGAQAARIELDAATAEGSAQSRVAAAQRLVAEGADKPLLDVHFSDENRGLVIGAYGLIFATTDAGKTWRSWMGRVPNPKGKHLYRVHAAGSTLLIAGEQGALFRSTDGGEGFEEVATPYVGTFFDIVGTRGGSLLLLGLRGHAYRSDARAWQRIETGEPNTLTAGAQLADGSLLLVDETGRILRSTDDGRTFRPLERPRSLPFTGLVEAGNGALVLTSARGITRLERRDIAAEIKQ